jgi:nitrogen fixation protein
MADNVNIIVQDTINDIVVNAAVIVETIDINVQAAVDVVDIVANPNNYVVNINRIIGEQVQSDWTQTDNQAPDYIKNKPTIPAAQVNSDWNATSGVAKILNKPTLATVATSGSYNDLINKPTIPTATSDLTNDGSDGVNPFITAADIPPVTGFVPYTGATANVNLGEYELKAGQVTLDTTPTGTAAVATTRWNDSIGSAETTLKGGSVVLKNGVDLVARVVNKVTPNATLTKAAYQAVRISGAQGQRLAVAYAQANNDNNSADTIGIVCETIATNQEGFILTVGQLEDINTTGSLQGETWVDGDVLYLSPTTAGKLTNIKPTGATGHIVVMGYVEYAHAIHGKIYVKIMNGWELDELHNVYINSPANNEGLFYDSADSLWKNKTIASALGYTPVTNARTISTTAPLSGGGDLSANRTLSITQASTSTDGFLSSTNWNTFNNKFTLPALTSGSVLFSNGTTIAQDNANLFWDDTNNRLGIGTNNPSAYYAKKLVVAAPDEDGITILANSVSSSSYVAFADGVTGNEAFRGYLSYKHLSDQLAFGSAGSLRMTIASTGNVLINTTTDAGFRLDVNGTSRVSGLMRSTDVFVVGGTATTNTANARFWSSGGQANTSGLIRTLYSDISWIPSSGSAEWYGIDFRPTINQTGGANGITRGIYIAPTLTAAADFRAIEVANGITILGAATTAKASLRIPSGTAPTTPVNGDIWFDGTDLKMRIGGVTKTFTLL